MFVSPALNSSFQIYENAIMDFATEVQFRAWHGSKIAIIIDPRFDELMVRVITMHMHYLNPLGWDLMIVSASKYAEMIKHVFPFCIFAPILPAFIYYDVENVPNISIDSYNKICTDLNFWNAIPSQYTHTCIFQKDCYIYKAFSDVWLQYDFVGAPWYNPSDVSPKLQYGVNGGFSLRKRATMIECLAKISWYAIRQYRKQQSVPDVLHMHEDVFFTHACEMLHVHMPSSKLLTNFAIETDFNLNACAYHGWNKSYQTIQQTSKIINYRKTECCAIS